jgi:hypothetical protein
MSFRLLETLCDTCTGSDLHLRCEGKTKWKCYKSSCPCHPVTDVDMVTFLDLPLGCRRQVLHHLYESYIQDLEPLLRLNSARELNSYLLRMIGFVPLPRDLPQIEMRMMEMRDGLLKNDIHRLKQHIVFILQSPCRMNLENALL